MATDEPTTEAGRRLLAGLPWRDRSEEQAWGRLIAAIEGEARAEREDAGPLRLAHDQALTLVLRVIEGESHTRDTTPGE